MCGIAGQLSFSRPPSSVLAMMEAIAHRGPDDSGLHHDGPVMLGFRRLAIVDLSPAGHQPMTNEDGTLWIVFNGEIYNYRGLADQLRAHGHQFHSQTDTEVILHAYEQWGSECLRHFNGMFAFALWDARRQELFCARDRFGVKPFYYAITPDAGLLFASEIKALLPHSGLPRPTLNPRMVYDFLTAGALDHTDATCFDGIRQLPAAHYLLAGRQGMTVLRYWDIPLERAALPDNPRKQDRRQLAERFGALLEDSIRLRLHADVPVGTCLSGGLDSSSIVCLTNRLLFADNDDLPWHARGERQKTFSACYDDARHDERAYIDEVLRATGAEANFTFPGHELPIADVIPAVVRQQDEPFGSTSILAQWHVMRTAAERGMKVMVDGQGADELLAGYHGFFGVALADDLLAYRPARFARDLIRYRQYHAPDGGTVARSTLNGLFPPPSPIRRYGRRLFSRADAARAWLGPAFDTHDRPTQVWVERPGTHLQAMLYNQAMHTSLPALLHYEDRNSMAFSIEARTPFLDYRLAEFLAGVPNNALLSEGVTKIILRNAMRDVLPPAVRTRRDKKGFSTPEDTWFRTTLREWTHDIVHSRQMAERGLVQPTAAQAIFKRHLDGETNDSTLIWRIVNVELWAREFLDVPRAAL